MVPVLHPVALVISALVLAASLRPGPAPAHPPARDGDLPLVAPAEVGMSAERLAGIDRVVRNAIAAGGFPGAAVIVGRHGAIAWSRGYGTLGDRAGTPVDPDRTLWDLASITKVVSTATAAMVLVDRGKLDLDAPVARWIPEFATGAKARVTVRHLLQHRSGLPAGRALPHGAPAAARRAVLRTALVAAPGERYTYSDLGPIVLGVVVEHVTGEPLDRFVRRTVHARLGMQATTYRPSRVLAARAAATSPAGGGRVHDGTARALGDVAGHAGLFATARNLATFSQFMLERGRRGTDRVVGDSTVALFTRRGPHDRQALGWETCAGGASCGRYLGPTAYGHNGFTGTSLWIDPERDLFVIVLTNWVAGDATGRVAPVAVLHDVRSDVADLAALAVVDGDTLAMPPKLRSDARLGW